MRLLPFVVVLWACDAGPALQRERVERAPVPGLGEVLDATTAEPSETSAPETTPEVDVAPEADPDTTATDSLDTPDPDTAADTVTTPDTTPTDTTADTTPETEVVTPAAGTPDDPIVVGRFPFVVDDTTATSTSSALDRYTCAAATDESGPERVYRMQLAATGTFVAELAEAAGVDVDIHVLSTDPANASPTSVSCVARANTRLVTELDAGTYWVVIDTFVATAGPKPGSYRLALEHIVLDAWQVVDVAPGIVWKQKVYANYAGGRQTINTVDVDLNHPDVVVRPHGGSGCIRPSRVGPAEGAVVAINGGFFDTGPGTCPPLDLIKIDGELVSMNRLTGAAQRSVGVDETGAPLIAWVDANRDWPAAYSAIGSYPSLVTDGAILIEPDKNTDFFDGRHPRTALALTSDDHLLLVTVDGRGPNGVGMTLAQLAQHLLNLGAVHGVNLDGGGSTAMWVAGQSLNGVVNYPSDGDGITHTGERGVSDLLLIFSEP